MSIGKRVSAEFIGTFWLVFGGLRKRPRGYLLPYIIAQVAGESSRADRQGLAR